MAKSRLPTPVKVGTWRVPVRRRGVLFTAEDTPADGLYHFRDHSIELARHLTEADEREILVHEILHACFERAAIPHLVGSVSMEVEEGVVRLLAPLLVDVLRSNPRLVAYLTAKEEAA